MGKRADRMSYQSEPTFPDTWEEAVCFLDSNNIGTQKYKLSKAEWR